MFNLGDEVAYQWEPLAGEPTAKGKGFVIGEPLFSTNQSQITIADDHYLGMPLSSSHCTLIGFDALKARRLRDAYNDRFPNTFKPPTDADIDLWVNASQRTEANRKPLISREEDNHDQITHRRTRR